MVKHKWGNDMTATHFDVIIIGGRCAGASLAIRLAEHNISVLLVDRATFPSRPNVPSAPFIHSGTIKLLDELGLNESEYTRAGSRIDRMVGDFVNGVVTEMNITTIGLQPDHFYGVDRATFDNALWQKASEASTVTAYDGFAVTKIQMDSSGQAMGIVGKRNQQVMTFTADLVVGADGRYSFLARQVGAQVVEERNQHTSAVYIAEWENMDDYSADYPHAITTYNTGKGLMVLVVPIAERTYHIGIAMRTDAVDFGEQGHTSAYESTVHSIPHLSQRLANAERISDVVGMKQIGNGYRQAYGTGWALVGDAVHYKDPSDGQGIYDALLTSKLLAHAINDWKHNNVSWEVAGATYQQQLMDETYEMFKQTVSNVKQNLYANVPAYLFKVMGKGLMTDRDFQIQFMHYLAREITPAEFRQVLKRIPMLMVKSLASDIRSRLVGASSS